MSAIPEGMAQGELDIAFAQGARTALKALGAVARPSEFIDDISIPAPDEDGERAKGATADRIKELIRRLEVAPPKKPPHRERTSAHRGGHAWLRLRVIAGFAMVVVTDDDVEGSQHGDEDDKIVFDELHTEIANCIEALHHGTARGR